MHGNKTCNFWFFHHLRTVKLIPDGDSTPQISACPKLHYKVTTWSKSSSVPRMCPSALWLPHCHSREIHVNWASASWWKEGMTWWVRGAETEQNMLNRQMSMFHLTTVSNGRSRSICQSRGLQQFQLSLQFSYWSFVLSVFVSLKVTFCVFPYKTPTQRGWAGPVWFKWTQK